MLECNLKLVCRVLLFANTSKGTRQSKHGTRLCGAAQGLHIAIYMYIVQKHSSIYTRHKTLWSSSRPTYCYIYRPKALVNLHTTQDFVEQLKAYILLYISSKSTRKSTCTHGTRLCGAAQGLHIAIYIVQKHSSIYTRHKTLWSSSRPTYCYIYIVQKHS